MLLTVPSLTRFVLIRSPWRQPRSRLNGRPWKHFFWPWLLILRAWINDIDSSLRAWPELGRRIAETPSFCSWPLRLSSTFICHLCRHLAWHLTTMATRNPSSRVWIPRLLDLRGLLSKRSCFLFGPRQRVVEGIAVLPFKTFLEALWVGEFR